MAQVDQLALTEQHRQAQLAIRAQALRDFALLWPMWKGDQASFQALVSAAVVLVKAYRQISAAAAVAYYQAFRHAADAAGVFIPSFTTVIPEGRIAASMYVTGRNGLRAALKAGQLADKAQQTALARTSGAVGRHVLDAGRQTIIDATNADPAALGWARITDGDPCAFCLTLASRGAVYKTEQTANFQAHDACGCAAISVFKGTEIPNLKKWGDIYDAAQAAAEKSGLFDHGPQSSKARLKAVRHYLEGV